MSKNFKINPCKYRDMIMAFYLLIIKLTVTVIESVRVLTMAQPLTIHLRCWPPIITCTWQNMHSFSSY